MKFYRGFFALLLAGTLVWSCIGDDNPLDPGSSVVDISIVNNKFVPAQKTVDVGTTVRWTNDDAVEMGNDFHTVDSGSPSNPITLSPVLSMTFTSKDDSGQYTFNTAGTFRYYCGRHGETGVITVQ